MCEFDVMSCPFSRNSDTSDYTRCGKKTRWVCCRKGDTNYWPMLIQFKGCVETDIY